ncbi:integrase [Pontibacter korlensis]|uniref:Integrase n=2 Tax=Pontibacter korlensis TaxID=400092 RepID=A0A0E3ZBP0_9BACT|nr:integrase [Pontibacter korlensis]AKD03281.1 integrase [Pontibacter korlensis]
MCKVLRVSSSGFYYWLKHPVGLRELREERLVAQIRQVHEQSRGRYGSPRISFELKEQGIQASRPRIARLMRKHQIQSIVRKKYRINTTDSNHSLTVAENYLNRDFTAARPAEKWVSDITYIRTEEGWLYLTAVLDLADRKAVGWALSQTMEAEATTVAAFQMALSNRPLSGELLFHSDRGVQYSCSAFREQLEGMPVLQSMSRKGNCWDNAVAESFFKTMKTEMVYHHRFATRQEAGLAVFEYIEGFYNRKRRHSALGYLTPSQVEEELYQQRRAA